MEANEMQVPMENQSKIVAGICFFNPQVTDEFKPTIGQRFETLDKVLEFYNNYAREAGFSDGEIMRKEFVHNKEGSNTKEWIGDKQKRRGLTNEGCKARLIVARSKLGGYAVTIFDRGHNHPMTSPRRCHLLKSYRKVTKCHKILADQLNMANIHPHKQFDILGLQVGGIENVGCT
ncbi:protein FAR1-RELATED SEQUENCE 5-like [Pyrus ussuriensis x Pyrus communis]|uniref:Protein FAR1-RELATED SEQUENCE 5-like n=1 Tax=Pyrus ussuriensis x Pyrus communis TaxID=2448454 RepID=A0A5N5I836_9ROSA|nr:protein FAR1-RELATED SEQUENCE 5-like [Pyrus ussuriensis x Pyrus communis]